MNGELRVASVKVTDVLGAREFSMTPGRITVLQGRNGSGKSTALKALQAALGGGNLAKLARVEPGVEVEPEVVLLIEGKGAEAYEVVKRGDDTAVVKARVGDTQAFETMGRPQTWLSSLFDPRGANPVTFLQAADKDRAMLLVEALPLTLDENELDQILGDLAKHKPAIRKGTHPLEHVALVHEAVFKAREGVNRDWKAKKGSADQLRRAMPAVPPEGQEAAIRTARVQRHTLAEAIAREQERVASEEKAALADAQRVRDEVAQTVTAEFRVAREKRKAAHAEEVRKLQEQHDEHVRQLEAALNRKIDHLREVMEGEIRDLDGAGLAKVDEADGTLRASQEEARTVRAGAEEALQGKREQLRELDSRVATLETQDKEAQRHVTLAEQVAQFDKDAGDLEEESRRMTATLQALEAFKRRLAKELPIPGLEIEGKDVRVLGVPYDQLNTQAQVDLAVDVSCLRAGGRLPIVFVDGAEALDHEHFEALVRRLEEKGVQAFLARVEDTDLQVIADGEPAAAAAR
jgi:hypothetical protein